MDGSVSSGDVNAGHQLVIVALPSEDDYVRQVSSEKEPHMTLAYLGDNIFTPEQLSHISDYIEHAASHLRVFYMDVVDRGVLGDANADVLFFNQKFAQNIKTFRDQLTQDPLISTAYNSVDQFPQWTPHLTLGYPESPAKKSPGDTPSIFSVKFDRIAFWTGDYEGPTFKLQPYGYDLEVAMSQTVQSRSVVDDILAHHGVKGMKWGVRRTPAQLSAAAGHPISEDAKAAKAAKEKIVVGGTQSLSNKELQNLVERLTLENRYHSAVTSNRNHLDTGLLAANKVLKAGETIEKARKFLNTPTGKAIKVAVKAAAAGVKIAAAGHTGGASAAAAAGAGLAVRTARNHYTNVGN